MKSTSIRMIWYELDKTEAVFQRCSVKKMFLEIVQNLQGISFRPATLLKRDPDTGVFLWILWNF